MPLSPVARQSYGRRINDKTPALPLDSPQYFSQRSETPRNIMPTPSGINTTGQGFFRLPGELRNAVYEYVLADLQDNVYINLERGLDEVNGVEAKKTEPMLADSKASRLNMLLTCRQINHEASGIAYSNMSLSIKTLIPVREGQYALTKAAPRLELMVENFAKTFGTQKPALVTRLVLRGPKLLNQLSLLNSFMFGHTRLTKNCTGKCESLRSFQGLVHETFHNIQCITFVDDDDTASTDRVYKALTKGASWLSVTMQPGEVKKMLNAFPSLEQIVVRRKSREQVSNVINREIFAAESGMPLGGMSDWLPNYRFF